MYSYVYSYRVKGMWYKFEKWIIWSYEMDFFKIFDW